MMRIAAQQPVAVNEPLGGPPFTKTFIGCGDPHFDCARIRCDTCGRDELLAFSRKST